MHLKSFQKAEIAEGIARRIADLADGEVSIMEVCGTHTMAIGQFGLRSLLPSSIQLLSGPGCPVCVTPERDIDRAIEIAQKYDVLITTFGDLLRVPGSRGSLEEARADGAAVKLIYSPFEAVEAAKSEPGKEVILLGIGFETTSPAIAAALKRAREEGIRNLSVLPMAKTVPPALRAILASKKAKIDGFILPGHVSAIIGFEPYEFIPAEFGVPCVITGFEPVDILCGILMLLEQVACGRSAVEVEYRRVVSPEGNPHARELVAEVFDVCDSEWRSIGTIPDSGLSLSETYEAFDARSKFPVQVPEPLPSTGCICGDILMGLALPQDCQLFGTRCAPDDPVGPCMVSSEGTCAAHFKYGGN